MMISSGSSIGLALNTLAGSFPKPFFRSSSTYLGHIMCTNEVGYERIILLHEDIDCNLHTHLFTATKHISYMSRRPWHTSATCSSKLFASVTSPKRLTNTASCCWYMK